MICAGVQNVSRPIDMCHAMSHGPPIIPLATPATMHQIVHGTDSTFAVVRALTRAAIGGRAICCPKGIDCPIACHSFAATTSGFFAALPRVYTPQPFLQTTCQLFRGGNYSQITHALPFRFSPPELYGTFAHPLRM